MVESVRLTPLELVNQSTIISSPRGKTYEYCTREKEDVKKLLEVYGGRVFSLNGVYVWWLRERSARRSFYIDRENL